MTDDFPCCSSGGNSSPAAAHAEVPRMTERQARDWPLALLEAEHYTNGERLPHDLGHPHWTATWRDETRPGRGQALDATWCNGEHIVQVYMDVYGGPRVSVGEVEWLHSTDDEQCGCDRCAQEREADG